MGQDTVDRSECFTVPWRGHFQGTTPPGRPPTQERGLPGNPDIPISTKEANNRLQINNLLAQQTHASKIKPPANLTRIENKPLTPRNHVNA